MAQRSVAQLITRQEVVSLPGGASVRAACKVMAEQRVGAVVVQTDGVLEGIFTERDALTRVLAEGRDPETTPLSEVMTSELVTVGRETAALDALRLMTEIGFRHLPVVDEEGLAGIISLRDFVGAELQQAAPDEEG